MCCAGSLRRFVARRTACRERMGREGGVTNYLNYSLASSARKGSLHPADFVSSAPFPLLAPRLLTLRFIKLSSAESCIVDAQATRQYPLRRQSNPPSLPPSKLPGSSPSPSPSCLSLMTRRIRRLRVLAMAVGRGKPAMPGTPSCLRR